MVASHITPPLPGDNLSYIRPWANLANDTYVIQASGAQPSFSMPCSNPGTFPVPKGPNKSHNLACRLSLCRLSLWSDEGTHLGHLWVYACVATACRHPGTLWCVQWHLSTPLHCDPQVDYPVSSTSHSPVMPWKSLNQHNGPADPVPSNGMCTPHSQALGSMP